MPNILVILVVVIGIFFSIYWIGYAALTILMKYIYDNWKGRDENEED